ncbi:MAG: bifunctional oligoribonuclease/PAP phosphatase NrnA [Lachnospiraceae bacterium]|nr:bifunctional oligoribonuclease/PAP phosphatase NrnA [Lachnospiraceae bacterium]
MKIDDLLKNVNSVGIAGHVRPDGDCVGSTLAVYNYISTYYPNVDLHVYLETIPTIFHFLKNSDKIEEATEDELVFDLFICCDCRELGRLGKAGHYFTDAKTTFCVDHHIGQGNYADYEYIIPDDSSTCELIFDCMDEEKVTKEIAECLYVGMVHDTGVFQYTCTSSKTMNVAGKLMDKGIDYSRIIDETYYQKSYKQNLVLGKALLKSKLYLNDRVIVSYITKEEMEEFGVLPRHLEGIVQQLRNTKEAEVAIFLYQTDEKGYKVSTRATGDVNLTVLAGKFGGGGHAKASGFSVYENPESAIKKILTELEKLL